ncbi:cation:proton antiporter [Mycoplasma sp. P36-A1]|uniref:cation:proton antiporter domain-containing protein n=1 Tax=Mycoplasma sp. P36-A1 TaxID=3252900 RepID=UPI003C2AE7C1
MFFESIAIMIIVGLVFAKLSQKIKLPGIFGMIIAGMLIGPFSLNLIDKQVLDLSDEIKKIALIILLLQAGISLKIKDIYKVKKAATLMSFIPSILEIIIVSLSTSFIFNISIIQGFLCGCIVAASSPAVIVPKMLQIKKEGLNNKGISETLICATSIEGIYIVLLFGILIQANQANNFEITSIINILIALILGLILGLIITYTYKLTTKIFSFSSIQKVILIIALSFVAIGIEVIFSDKINISGMFAVAILSLLISGETELQTAKIQESFANIWVFVQVILFVFVGASISASSLIKYGIFPLIIILLGLFMRIVGVYISEYKGNLNKKEKLFIAGAFTPKATVQAAIASTPLALGISSGELLQTIGLLSILVAAPIGAVWIDKTKDKLLA